MAMPADLFVPHSVHIDTPSLDDWVDGLQNADVDQGISVFEESGGSETDREFVAVRDRMPTLSMRTLDLTFMSVCGLNGIAITPDGSNPGLYAWGVAVPNKGRRTAIASSAHLRMQCSDGLIVPVSVSAGHNQPAMLELILHGILGSAAQSTARPFLFTKNQQVTAGAGATVYVFTAGAVKFTSGGNTLVLGVQDIRLNYGLQVLKEGSNGEVDPTHISIGERRPTFEFSTRDGELLADVTEDGLACTSFAMYFRKVALNGRRVAEGTGEHVSIVATSGLLLPGAKNLPHNRAGTARFTFRPVLDTQLFTISATATIPTS